jgi:hypothetical protein
MSLAIPPRRTTSATRRASSLGATHSGPNGNIRNPTASSSSKLAAARAQKQALQHRDAGEAAAEIAAAAAADYALTVALEAGPCEDARMAFEGMALHMRDRALERSAELEMQQAAERARIDELREALRAANRRAEGAHHDASSVRSHLAEARATLAEIRGQIDALHRRRDADAAVAADAAAVIHENERHAETPEGVADLAALATAEQRLSTLRAEHAALTDAASELGRRLRDAIVQRDALSGEIKSMRALQGELDELRATADATGAREMAAKHAALEARLAADQETFAVSNQERRFLVQHLAEGARESASTLLRLRSELIYGKPLAVPLPSTNGNDSVGPASAAGGTDDFLYRVLQENVSLRRNSAQVAVDCVEERIATQEYVQVLMSRVTEATKLLHRDTYDLDAAMALRERAMSP